MRDPSFWWRPPGLLAQLLAPAACVYGAVAAWRMARPGNRARVPVVCVGNLTVGGAGKTPTAIAIAALLRQAGRRPVFLTRGYGGRLAGPLRVTDHGAAEVGDEPLLLARIAPTIVASDRVAGAALAAQDGDIVVMDDGLQNPALEKDFALVVIDGRRGIGNGRVIPAGPLRAPLDVQLARAHALLLIGEASGAEPVRAAGRARGLPVLTARLVPDAATVAALKGVRTLAFAGIADPQKFFATLAAAGVPAVVTTGFPDHHRYSAADAARLLAQAERDKLQLLTTEKDLARMQGDLALGELAGRAKALPATLMFDDAGAVLRLLERSGVSSRHSLSSAAAPPRG